MRRLRFIPEGGVLVEVTCRTLQSRFLFRPHPRVNDIVVGVLGRAQRKYVVRICSYVFASNHFHLILEVDDALQLARFMGYVSSNLARKVGRFVGWREKIWSRRYQAIVISSEAPAQVERLRYVLAHGVKEGLVEKVSQWPGLHCAHSLLTGEAVEGYWFDGTREYAARRRGEEVDPDSAAFAIFPPFQESTRPSFLRIGWNLSRTEPIPGWVSDLRFTLMAGGPWLLLLAIGYRLSAARSGPRRA